MGRQFLRTMDVEEVKRILNNISTERKIETVSLENAYRRILAENINASINLPPFNRASMDGYAVRVEDIFEASEEKPVVLRLVDIVEAGDTPTKKVEKGTCIEVSTGAPIPEGADGVIMIEFTEKTDENVYIYDSVVRGQDIATEASDIGKEELLLTAGVLLTPDKIGVLSAIGMTEVPVFVKPKVAVISTGNEIIEHYQELKYGKIYDVNSQSITNAVRSCGCTPINHGIVKDNYEDVSKKLDEALGADIIITSGGTSAGAGDILNLVLDDMGDILVHGIAMKPGKPTIIGMIKDKVIFGLPGYPVAALIVFQVLVAPFLRRTASQVDYDRKNNVVKLKISRRYHSARGRLHYVLVKVDGYAAHPILKDSGAITALAEADGYFEVPKNVEIVEEGSEIQIVLFGD